MRILIGALALIVLAGCSTTPMSAQDAAPVPSDELYAFQSKTADANSRITVIRDGGFVGSGCDLVFYIEGRRSAKIGPGQRASFYVEPGPVNLGTGLAESGLCAGAAIRTISANIKAGTENQFRISGDMSGFFLAPYVDYGGR